MDIRRQAALFSAASYLCSAAEDLRSAGYGALAEEISGLVAYLDPGLVASVDEAAPISVDPGVLPSSSNGFSPAWVDPTA